MSAEDPESVIRALALTPHPEGGWFRETWRATAAPGERAAGTAIYYLLLAGERSRWHRVDATEIWHFYAGEALELTVAPPDGRGMAMTVLSPDLGAGHRPQATVDAGWWQSARPLGDWTLVGCTVSPGFEFAGFQLAPEDWVPSDHGVGPRHHLR